MSQAKYLKVSRLRREDFTSLPAFGFRLDRQRHFLTSRLKARITAGRVKKLCAFIFAMSLAFGVITCTLWPSRTTEFRWQDEQTGEVSGIQFPPSSHPSEPKGLNTMNLAALYAMVISGILWGVLSVLEDEKKTAQQK